MHRYWHIRHRRKRRWIQAAGIVFVVWFVLFVFVFVRFSQDKGVGNPVWGITFSDKYARELGLDSNQVLRSLLDDMQVRNIRLPVYWDDVERERGVISLDNIRRFIGEIEERNGSVVLSVGMRLPRWPECHIPQWANALPPDEFERELLEYVDAVVRAFSSSSAVSVWQVENEPFLSTFGKCPSFSEETLEKEIAVIRSRDPFQRPVMVTESGELSTWLRASRFADIVGVSLYRVTWNRRLGYFYYPIPSWWYSLKARIVGVLTGVPVIVSELQVEPWTGRPIRTVPLSEQYRSMDTQRFRDTIEYAKKTGISQVYLWGAEWWYWMREKGNSEYWEIARGLFRTKE